mmetsp:Transcript_47182/g.109924  ORF Transcript_47182/g.109924 Transcript_47182/m.109924 type:complete len:1392 (-) Transcript_47182:83-4258(-)
MDVAHGSNVSAPLCFLIIALLTGSIMHGLTHLIPVKWRPPSSVSLFLCGWILPWIGESMATPNDSLELLSEALQAATEVDPHLVFYALLPPLLYESAAGLSWHVFRRVASSSIILAIPGVMVNVLFVTLFLIWGFGKPWKLSTAMLSGAILSATDPVAVVACLRSLHAPKKLSSLIEGESLINDGSAVVLFLIAESMVEDEYDGKEGMGFAGSVMLFVQLAVGGPLFGILMAWVCELWLKRVHDDKITEVSIVVSLFFATYFVGEEMLHVSGVLGTVFFGIFMGARGRFALDVGHEESLRAVVEQVAHFADEAIFVIAGSVTNRLMRQGFDKQYVGSWQVFKLFALYFALHLFRATVVGMFMPVLNRLGYGLQWKEAVFLVFAGLRGAVGLALVLLAQLNPKIDEEIRVLVGFYISGFTCLTLCVNGTLARSLYIKLNMYPESEMRGLVLGQVMRQIKEKGLVEAKEVFQEHWLFRDVLVDFSMLVDIVPNFEEVDIDKESGSLICRSTPPVLVFREMMQAAKLEHELEEEQQQLPDLTSICQACGNKFQPDSKFCRKCGRKRPSFPKAPGSPRPDAQPHSARRLSDADKDAKQPANLGTDSSANFHRSISGSDGVRPSTVSRSLRSRTNKEEYSKVLGDAAAAPAFTSENSAAQSVLLKSKSMGSRRGSADMQRRQSSSSGPGDAMVDVFQRLNQFAGNSEYLVILLLQSTSIQYVDLYERKDLEARPFNELSDAVTEGIDFANKESISGTTTKHIVKRLKTANFRKVLMDDDQDMPSTAASDVPSESFQNGQASGCPSDPEVPDHPPDEQRQQSAASAASAATASSNDGPLLQKDKSSGAVALSVVSTGAKTPKLAARSASMAFTLDTQIQPPPQRRMQSVHKVHINSLEQSEAPAVRTASKDPEKTPEGDSLTRKPTGGTINSSPRQTSIEAPTDKGLFMPGQVSSAWGTPPQTGHSQSGLDAPAGGQGLPESSSSLRRPEDGKECRTPSKGIALHLPNVQLPKRAPSHDNMGGNSQSASAAVEHFLHQVKDNIVSNNRVTQEAVVMAEMSAWDIEWIRLHHYLSPKEPTPVVGNYLPKFGSDFLELKAKLQVIYAYVEAHTEVVEDARSLLSGAAPESLAVMELHIQMAKDSIWGLCPDPVMLRLARMVLSAIVLLNIVEHQLKDMVRGGCLSERDAKEMFQSLEHQRKGLHECHPQMLKVKLPAYALEEGKWSWFSLIRALYRRRENVRKRVAAEKHAEAMRNDAIIQGYCFKLNHGVQPQSSNTGDWTQRLFVLLRETKVLNYISEKKGGELIPVGSVATLLSAWREEVPELGMSAIVLEFPGKKLCVLGFQHNSISNGEAHHEKHPAHESGQQEMDRWSQALTQIGVAISSAPKPPSPSPEPLT